MLWPISQSHNPVQLQTDRLMSKNTFSPQTLVDGLMKNSAMLEKELASKNIEVFVSFHLRHAAINLSL